MGDFSSTKRSKGAEKRKQQNEIIKTKLLRFLSVSNDFFMGSQNSSTFMTERAYRNMESLRSTPNSRTNRKENVHRGALTNGRPQKKQDPFRDEENSGEEGPDALYQAYMDYTPWGIGESSSASYDATAMTIVGPEACRYRIHDWYYSFFRCLPYSETIILEEDFLGRTDHSNNNTSKRKEEVIYGQVKHIWEEELFLGVVEDLYDEIMETRDATPVNGPQHGGETATHVTSFTDGLCSLLHDEDGEETLPKVRKGSHCPCTVKPLLDNASRGNYNGSEAALLSLTDWIQAEDLLNEEVDDDDLSVGAPSSRSAEDTNHNNNTNTSFGHSSDDDPTTTKGKRLDPFEEYIEKKCRIEIYIYLMRRMVSRLNKVYQERQRSLHTNRHASGIPSGPSTAATEEREAKYLKDKINLVFLFHHFLLKCLQVVSSLHAVRPLASDYYDASATNNNKAFAARNVFLQSNAFFKIQEDSFHYIMHQSLNPIIMYFYNLFEETNQYEFFYNKHYGGDQRRRESELIATIDFNELLPYLFYISNLTSEESGNEDHDNNEDSQRIPDDDDLWDIRHYYGVEECENLYKNKDNISCLAKIKLFEEFKNNYSIHLIKLNSFMDRMEKNYHRDKLEQEEVHKVYEGTRGSDHDDFSPPHQGRMKHEGQETYSALPYSKTKRAGQKKKAVSCGTDCTLM